MADDLRNSNRLWALELAARPAGFFPHALTTAKFLQAMEAEGLVRRSDVSPVWYATDEGRKEIARLRELRYE